MALDCPFCREHEAVGRDLVKAVGEHCCSTTLNGKVIVYLLEHTSDAAPAAMEEAVGLLRKLVGDKPGVIGECGVVGHWAIQHVPIEDFC